MFVIVSFTEFIALCLGKENNRDINLMDIVRLGLSKSRTSAIFKHKHGLEYKEERGAEDGKVAFMFGVIFETLSSLYQVICYKKVQTV